MALNNTQLAEIRRAFATRSGTEGWAIDFDKITVNAALQAIETAYENNKVALSNAIDAATNPVSLTTPQKKALGAYWLRQKFDREVA